MTIATIAITIIVALLVLSVLVVIHEYGHYLAGKKAGITVTDFAVGFGPKLVKWQRGETEFSIRLLPLGGFCKFLGEDEDADEEGSFNKATLFGRFMTVLSGPVFNIVVAFIMGACLMLFFGNRVTMVESTMPGMSAEAEGVQAGDIITSVNGKATPFSGQALQYLASAGDTDIEVTVTRDGTPMTFQLDKSLDDGEMRVGITTQTIRQKVGFFEGIWLGIRWSFYLLVEMIKGLGQMIGALFGGPAIEGGVAGPVGVVTLIGDAARNGFESLLALATMLSINLGIVNLLPLPALDGGRLIFFIIEAVRGKPVPPEREGFIHMLGFAALMVLIAVLTYGDIMRLVRGEMF